jgi:hypothetical protein
VRARGGGGGTGLLDAAEGGAPAAAMAGVGMHASLEPGGELGALYSTAVATSVS